MKKIAHILLLILLFIPLPVFGRERPSEVSLTISPLINKLEVEPGGTRTGILEVFNMGSQEVEMITQTRDFEDSQGGHVQFISREKMEERSHHVSLGKWITVGRDSFTVPPGDGEVITFRIDVPEDAEPGGKYSSVLVTTKTEEEDSESTEIELGSGVGSLFLVNVKGDTKVDAQLTDFSTDDLFYRDDQISFSLAVENLGNVHIQPRGSIRIYNSRGQQVDSIDINRITDFGNILPQSERAWNFTWKRKDDIINSGRYKAVLFLDYGSEEGEEIYKEVDFWVLPVDRRGAVFSGALLLLFLTLVLYRFIQFYGSDFFKNNIK